MFGVFTMATKSCDHQPSIYAKSEGQRWFFPSFHPCFPENDTQVALVFRYNLGTPKGSTWGILVTTCAPRKGSGFHADMSELDVPAGRSLFPLRFPRPSFQPTSQWDPRRPAPLREVAKATSPSPTPLSPAKNFSPRTAPPG